MQAEWIADRATLRSLAREHPEWTQQDLANALGRSLSWVKKWLKGVRDAPPDDLQVLLSHSRAHHTPYPQVHPRIIQRIVEIREHPPENLQRTPGPRAILYYLPRDQEGPRTTSLSSALHAHQSFASCGSSDVSWMHLIVLAAHKSVPILWKRFNSISRM